MTDAKQRSDAAKLYKLLIPLFLIAGFTLFFHFNGHEYLSFIQFAENYTSLKAFVDSQLIISLLVFGLAYIMTVALSPSGKV